MLHIATRQRLTAERMLSAEPHVTLLLHVAEAATMLLPRGRFQLHLCFALRRCSARQRRLLSESHRRTVIVCMYVAAAVLHALQ